MTTSLNLTDSSKAIAASIAVAVVGWAVFMGLPIMVGALVEFRGFSEEQVGYLASADLGGMFISSIIVSLRISRMDRRFWVMTGIFIAIFADVIAIYSYEFWPMLFIRIVAGIGAGLCYSIALANLAATSNNARNFSYLIFTLVTVNFLELYSLEVISDHWGVSGIFVAFIAINVLCLFAYPYLPRGKFASDHMTSKSEAEFAVTSGHLAEPAPAVSHQYNLPLLSMLCLTAIACFYIMIGAFWAYIERMGVTAGFGDNFIAAALSITTLLSLVGCYVAYSLSKVQGQSKPLIAAAAICTSMIYAYVYADLKRKAPTLADAR